MKDYCPNKRTYTPIVGNGHMCVDTFESTKVIFSRLNCMN